MSDFLGKLLLSLVSVFSGAYFGAFFAYRFNVRQNKKAQKAADLLALLEAKYVIEKMKNFYNEGKACIAERREFFYVCVAIDQQNKPISILCYFFFDSNLPEIPTTKLLFLIRKEKELLDKLVNVNTGHRWLNDLLEKYNPLYESYLEKTNGIRDIPTEGQLTQIIGEEHWRSLKLNNRMIEDLVKLQSEDCETCLNVIKIMVSKKR